MSEVDAALRQVSRRFPDALARALTKPTATVRDARWIETQLSSRRRSLDRALEVIALGVTRIGTGSAPAILREYRERFGA